MAMNEQVEVGNVVKDQRREDIQAPVIDSSESRYEGYHEIPKANIETPKTSLDQLKANISALEDLHGRLRFMMGEIKQHVVKS